MGTDSLYYIMDYSGRRTGGDGIAFAQANSRICVGKKASFYCMVSIEETEEDMSGEVSGSNEKDDRGLFGGFNHYDN